jgi:hypothetical protein
LKWHIEIDQFKIQRKEKHKELGIHDENLRRAAIKRL